MLNASCSRRRDAAKVVAEEPAVVRAAREDSTDSLLPVARQPLTILAGVDRVTVRVVAESSRREARVSKIRVSNKEYKRHESRRARDVWSAPRTHLQERLEHSLKLSESPRVFQASRVYVALVRSDAIIKSHSVYFLHRVTPA